MLATKQRGFAKHQRLFSRSPDTSQTQAAAQFSTYSAPSGWRGKKNIVGVMHKKKYTSMYTHTQNTRTHTHTQTGKRPYMLRWWIHSICMLLGTPKCPENVSNMREITNWGVLKFTYIYYPYQHIHTSEQVLLFCSHIDIRNISRHFCASDLCVHVCVCVRQWVVLVLVLLLVLMLVLVFIRVYKRGACGR